MARASTYLASAFEDPPEEGVDYPEEHSPSGRRVTLTLTLTLSPTPTPTPTPTLTLTLTRIRTRTLTRRRLSVGQAVSGGELGSISSQSRLELGSLSSELSSGSVSRSELGV